MASSAWKIDENGNENHRKSHRDGVIRSIAISIINRRNRRENGGNGGVKRRKAGVIKQAIMAVIHGEK